MTSCFDWFGRAHDYCEKAGITNGVMPTQWAMHLDYGCSLDTWLEAVKPMATDGVYLDAPIPGSVESLRRIVRYGHSVVLITARGAFEHGDVIKRHTRVWVSKYLPFVDDVVFSAEKWKPRTDIFIDDTIKNYDSVVAHGVHGVLLNRPHNAPYDDGRNRVESMDEFANRVIKEGLLRREDRTPEDHREFVYV